jgi:hypothetical protein
VVIAIAQGNRGFVHGIVIDVDGEECYFSGAPDGPNGETDIPGHYWVKTGLKQLIGKHYNRGLLEQHSGGLPMLGRRVALLSPRNY